MQNAEVYWNYLTLYSPFALLSQIWTLDEHVLKVFCHGLVVPIKTR